MGLRESIGKIFSSAKGPGPTAPTEATMLPLINPGSLVGDTLIATVEAFGGKEIKKKCDAPGTTIARISVGKTSRLFSLQKPGDLEAIVVNLCLHANRFVQADIVTLPKGLEQLHGHEVAMESIKASDRNPIRSPSIGEG